MSRGVAFVLVCSEEYAKKINPDGYVTIDGMGLSSCTIRAGDRLNFPGWTERYGKGYPGMTEFGACRNAADRAYKMAGIEDPRNEIDILEVDDKYSYKELQHLEAIGYAKEGEAGKLLDEGKLSNVNVSGGALGVGNCLEATGLQKSLEIVTQLRGYAGKRQLKDVKTGLAQSWRGLPSPSGAVAIFRRG